MPTVSQVWSAAVGAVHYDNDVSNVAALNVSQIAKVSDVFELWDDVSAYASEEVADNFASSSQASQGSGISKDWNRVAVADIDDDNALGYNISNGIYHEIYIDTQLEGLETFALGSSAFVVLLHEIGHSIVLDHNDPTSNYSQDRLLTVMTGGSANSDQMWHAATPMILDIDNAIARYGQTSTTRTGNDTYGFNASFSGDYRAAFDFAVNLRPLVTIFDDGGVDTLDGSGFTLSNGIAQSVYLDLRSGPEFSSHLIGGAGHTFAFIYRTSTIENAVAGGGFDTLIGNSAANILSAGAGRDVLDGGDNDDTLIGGMGSDRMTGGQGLDTFSFFSTRESGKALKADIVTDFVAGEDSLDVATVLPTSVGDVFRFIGTQRFHDVAGELRYRHADAVGSARDFTVIEADLNGDHKVDFSIKLMGLHTLAAEDFVL